VPDGGGALGRASARPSVAASGPTPGAELPEVFASFFKKKTFLALFFYEKKIQKSFASREARC
jgi:hypothetical protein